MIRYIFKRLLRSVITLLIIVSIVFVLMRQMPIEGYFPNFDHMSQEQIKASLAIMGLDKPIPVQLFNFLKGVVTEGSLGISYVYRDQVPVTEILATKIPLSIKLGVLALCFALLVGLPLGTMMAQNKGRFLDKLGNAFIVCIQAVPSAVYFLFIQIYATEWFGLPLTFKEAELRTWILPIFSLALPNISYYGMWLRRYMVDESTKDYVKLAKIKGLSGAEIMFKHVFRNAFVPLGQYLPTTFLNTCVGSIYVESLYSIPGMGGLLVDVVKRQDNSMVQAIVMLFASVGIIGLIVGDIMMTLLDPRVSFVAKKESR
ncbi:MAG: ABC transporter permease [Clostridia bacterium]|nr:ABC transporter permease [Clostridia bacterium]